MESLGKLGKFQLAKVTKNFRDQSLASGFQSLALPLINLMIFNPLRLNLSKTQSLPIKRNNENFPIELLWKLNEMYVKHQVVSWLSVLLMALHPAYSQIYPFLTPNLSITDSSESWSWASFAYLLKWVQGHMHRIYCIPPPQQKISVFKWRFCGNFSVFHHQPPTQTHAYTHIILFFTLNLFSSISFFFHNCHIDTN